MHFKCDLGILALFSLLTSALALYCDKSFTYYEEYGQNSFNVTCSEITKGYEHILENITINNEISLTITDSQLENVTPNIFRNVRNIKLLNINNCSFSFDKRLAIFRKLDKLENLVIRDTGFEIGNVTLQGLGSLKRLELKNNSISSVAKGGFTELINLERIELTDNHVENLGELQLCELKKLRLLKLKRNRLSSLKYFYFFCMRNVKSDFYEHSVIPLPNIYQDTYFNISDLVYDLLQLDLSFNQIVDVDYSLENLGKLRTLDLSFNKLSAIKYEHFKWLLKLQKLILNNNALVTFESKVFANKTLLSLVNLSYNSLTSFRVADAPQLQFLDLSHNVLSSITLSNLNNLRKLNLAFNNLRNLHDDDYRGIPNLESVNFEGNSLDLRQGMFRNMQGLKFLSIAHNSLINITEKVFLGLKNLRVLDLSSNRLEYLNKNTFDDLWGLEALNLSSNSIASLSYEVLGPLKNLRSLDIAANKLVFVEYDAILSKLPGLSNINIKFNQLTCENLSKIIDYLKQRHIVYTSSERLDVDELTQNVAGIPCRPATTTINRLMISMESKPKGHGTLFNFGIFLIVFLVSVLTGIVTYRFYIYLKRRRYRADEFELVVD